tara:strand:- start:1030 stop:1947 length:918 start_codon:yes stop_codon:yes gene_type:complete
MKILIIGCGIQGLKYLEVFKAFRISVVGICVKNRYKNRSYLIKNYRISKIYFNIKESLTNSEYDAVFVFLPWYSIEKLIPDIIKYSKANIFTEKPIALSTKKINKIVNLSTKYKKKVYVLYNRRYYSNILHLKKLIKKKQILNFNGTIFENKTKFESKNSKKLHSKYKYFMTSHWIDLLMFLFNKIKFEVKKLDANSKVILIKGQNLNGTLTLVNKINDTLKLNFYGKNGKIYKFDTLEKMIKSSNLRKVKETLTFKKQKIIIEENKYKPGLYNLIHYFIKNPKNPKYLPKVNDLAKLYKILKLV